MDNYGLTKIAISPQSFHLKIFDDEFDYLMYDNTTTDLKDIKIELYKDISYRIELETKWQSSEIKEYQFIEDDHGNLIKEKPNIYTQNTLGTVNIPFDFDESY